MVGTSTGGEQPAPAHRRTALLTLAAVVVLALAGTVAGFAGLGDAGGGSAGAAQGGGQRGGDVPAELDGRYHHPRTEEGLRRAALQFNRIRYRARGRPSYPLLSSSCREQVTREAWSQHLFFTVAYIVDVTGVTGAEITVESVEVEEVDVDAGTGTARAVVVDGAGGLLVDGEPERYVYEAPTWRFDSCESV